MVSHARSLRLAGASAPLAPITEQADVEAVRDCLCTPDTITEQDTFDRVVCERDALCALLLEMERGELPVDPDVAAAIAVTARRRLRAIREGTNA
jgi:hypothetical protein